MKYLMVLAIVLVLSSCTKMMNENQCLVADWRTIGFQDGSAGRTEQWLGKRGEACAEFGVAPDMDQYLIGREQGLQSFCQPRRGFDYGRRNVRYNNVCPPALEPAFLNAYQDGLGLREREYNVTSIENAIAGTINELNVLEGQITDDTIILATEEMTIQERVDFALSIKHMAEQMGRLRERLPQIEADRDAARYDLDNYRASIIPKYPGSI